MPKSLKIGTRVKVSRDEGPGRDATVVGIRANGTQVCYDDTGRTAVVAWWRLVSLEALERQTPRGR